MAQRRMRKLAPVYYCSDKHRGVMSVHVQYVLNGTLRKGRPRGGGLRLAWTFKKGSCSSDAVSLLGGALTKLIQGVVGGRDALVGFFDLTVRLIRKALAARIILETNVTRFRGNAGYLGVDITVLALIVFTTSYFQWHSFNSGRLF